MNRVRALFDLQQIDTRIDAVNSEIAQAEHALQDTSQLDAAHQTLTQVEGELVSARSNLRELEAAAQKEQDHADDLEKKLYGGQIKGQKEMVAAQHEIETFRTRKKETDDNSFAAMEILDQAENTYKAAKNSLAATMLEREKEVQSLKERISEKQAAIEPLQMERDKRFKEVNPGDLPLYNKLRGQKNGLAVAEIVGAKNCSGCRVEQPGARLREIRSGMIPTTCHNCGRILYFKLQ